MGNNINSIGNNIGLGNPSLETDRTRAKQLKEDAARQAQADADRQRDSVDVPSRPVVRVAPEAEPALLRGGDVFNRVKQTSENLKSKLDGAAVQGELGVAAQKKLDEIVENIHQAQSEGNKQLVNDLEKKRVELLSCLNDYHSAFEKMNAEAISKNPATVVASATQKASEEEQALLKQFQGLTKISSVEGKEIESLYTEVLQKFKAQTVDLTNQKNNLEKEIIDFRKSSDPANLKNPLADQIRVKETELSQVKSRLQEIQSRAVQAGELADKISFLKARRDLNMSDREESLQRPAQEASELKSSSVDKIQSSSGRGGPAASQGASVSVASVSGGRRSGERIEQLDLRVQDAQEHTASNEDVELPGSQNVVTQDDVNLAIANTVTSFQVQSVSTNIDQIAKKTDKQVKKLLQQIKAGNVDALTLCMILIPKKASTTMLNMGLQVIKSLDAFDKQTADLSKSITNIQGNDTSANARLSKVSLEMNTLSSNRQTTMSVLKECMSAVEEAVSSSKSYTQKMDQIKSIASR